VDDEDAGEITMANPVHAAVLALEDRDGRLVPETVVRVAADPGSPLHSQFEWDDGKAGHAYRIEQARRLIRAVRLIVITETRTISTVHYVRDPSRAEREQGYISVPRLQSDHDAALAMLRLEFARAAACLRRAEDLADALGLRQEVVAVARRVERARRKIDRHISPSSSLP
jgi:hypothetical protein